MNKQDLAGIRKELKTDNTMLKVNEIYSVYLKKDEGVVIHSELDYFENFDSEKQDIYLKNFKKIKWLWRSDKITSIKIELI